MSRQRSMDIRKLERLLVRGLHEGWMEHTGVRNYTMRLGMDCEEPYRFELYSRGSIRDGKRVRPLTIVGESRCRKCFACSRRRSKMWAARAIHEFEKWPRTLFGTFTLSPEEHFQVDVRAEKLLREQSIDFDCASDAERFRARARVFGSEVTAWLKRIRSGRDGHTMVPLRYLLVAEVHDSEKTSSVMRGRPHYHMLLHEMEAGSAVLGSPTECLSGGECGEWEVRSVPAKAGGWKPAVFVRDEAFIRKNWTLGHTKFQWAEDAKSAFYVCKYLTKAMHVRVRASLHYGDPLVSSGRSLSVGRDSSPEGGRAALTPPYTTLGRGEED